jgi:hypothetical protein
LTSRARAFPVLFELADYPPSPCGLSARRQFIPVRRDVLHVLVLIGFVLGFRSWFADGPSFSSGRSGSRADGPPGLRGRSVFLGLSLVVLVAFLDCPWLPAGLSAAPLRPLLAGKSARAWQLCSLVRFLPPFFRASACTSRNRS